MDLPRLSLSLKKIQNVDVTQTEALSIVMSIEGGFGEVNRLFPGSNNSNFLKKRFYY